MSMKKIRDTFQRMYRNSQYRFWLYLLGIFTMVPLFIYFKGKKGKDEFAKIKADVKKELEGTDLKDRLYKEAVVQVNKKNAYFKKEVAQKDVEKQAMEIAEKNFATILQEIGRAHV